MVLEEQVMVTQVEHKRERLLPEHLQVVQLELEPAVVAGAVLTRHRVEEMVEVEVVLLHMDLELMDKAAQQVYLVVLSLVADKVVKHLELDQLAVMAKTVLIVRLVATAETTEAVEAATADQVVQDLQEHMVVLE